MLAIVNEIKFSKNSNELYNLMIKKILQDNTAKSKRRSDEKIREDIQIAQNRIANLQDDYTDERSVWKITLLPLVVIAKKTHGLQLETNENKTN